MCIRYLVVLLLVISLPCALLGQEDASKAVRATNFMNRLGQMPTLQTGDVFRTLPSAEISEVVGDPYWDKHWANSSLQFYKNDQMAEGYLTRYNIYSKEFEFKIQNGIKILPGAIVKNLVWIDSLTKATRFLVNAAAYQKNDVPLVGFLEVLVEGENNLFKKISLEILKPDFSPALNIGSKDTRIVKNEDFFFNVGNELIRIKSKKDLIPIFKNKERQMDIYIKKEGIKFRSEADLIKIFNYFLAELMIQP